MMYACSFVCLMEVNVFLISQNFESMRVNFAEKVIINLSVEHVTDNLYVLFF